MAARRVDVGEVRLAVTEAGDGEPVVMLHGFPELARCWRHQVAALAGAGYRAIAPDLRGYGGSDRPPAVEDYTAPKLVGDVVGLIDALGYESVHLVGHDWGGGLAWGLAGRMPERVRSLTILNAPQPAVSARLRVEDERQRAKSWYMLLFQFAGVAETWLSADDWANLRALRLRQRRPGHVPARGAGAAHGGARTRRRADRGAQLVPGQHAAVRLAAAAARPGARSPFPR